MKIKNIILTLYLTNEKVVRIKANFIGLLMLFVAFSCTLIFGTLKFSESRTVVAKLEPSAPKVIKVTKAQEVVQEKFKIKTVSNGKFEIKDFSINKDGAQDSMRFFLTSKDGRDEVKKGLIKVSHLDAKGEIRRSYQVNEFFEFKYGRFTDIPVVEGLRKVLVQVYDSGNVVLQNVIELKNGTINLRAE